MWVRNAKGLKHLNTVVWLSTSFVLKAPDCFWLLCWEGVASYGRYYTGCPKLCPLKHTSMLHKLLNLPWKPSLLLVSEKTRCQLFNVRCSIRSRSWSPPARGPGRKRPPPRRPHRTQGNNFPINTVSSPATFLMKINRSIQSYYR